MTFVLLLTLSIFLPILYLTYTKFEDENIQNEWDEQDRSYFEYLLENPIQQTEDKQ